MVLLDFFLMSPVLVQYVCQQSTGFLRMKRMESEKWIDTGIDSDFTESGSI